MCIANAATFPLTRKGTRLAKLARAFILNGVTILQRVISNQPQHYSHDHFYFGLISEAIEALRMLRSLLIQRTQIQGGNEKMLEQRIRHSAPDNFNDSTWNTNALDILNYVTATDWMYEVPEPFIGFLDVDELDVGQLPRSPLGPG
ncbi:hypothetical protein N7532_007060 [Penicillium argentinense]|uniref:Uncharacterized protein n=1 Tax=Penicillium argentinense TaxID=1131581 RepID=A0A9W9FH75_9EURO|nr:uncharacterized protein N7532_007060 [Penicillium argentinense]KAJ5100059.1 hypothetical protein N7532_007060 [Penicillium argentinense]